MRGARRTHERDGAKTREGAANIYPIDARVGARVRKRRVELGMTQQALGGAVNLSYQQIQKYERGTNRITAGLLWVLSEVLEVDVAYFYAAVDGALVKASADILAPRQSVRGTPSDRETLELIKGYRAVRDPKIRRSIRNTISTFAKLERNGAQRNRQPAKGRPAGA